MFYVFPVVALLFPTVMNDTSKVFSDDMRHHHPLTVTLCDLQWSHTISSSKHQSIRASSLFPTNWNVILPPSCSKAPSSDDSSSMGILTLGPQYPCRNRLRTWIKQIPTHLLNSYLNTHFILTSDFQISNIF